MLPLYEPNDLLPAIARAWCRPENEDKPVDVALAASIAEEIALLLNQWNGRVCEGAD